MQLIKELKYNRWGYLLAAFMPLFLGSVMIWAGYYNEGQNDEQPEERPLYLVVFCTFIAIFCVIFFIWLMKSFFFPPVIFRISEKGFEAIPNGVSTGFVKWENVAAVKEIIMNVTGGTGTRKDAAIAIYLKNATEYVNKQPIAIKLLLQLAKRTEKYKFPDEKDNIYGDNLPILIERATLGSDADEIIQLMIKLSGTVKS